MWDGFIGQRIAATNRTLRRFGVGLLLVALALCAYFLRPFINTQQGPVAIDEAHLVAISHPNLVLRNFVTVEGRNTASSGITEVEKNIRNGTVESQTTTAEYMATVVGKHILIVKADPGDKAQKYTGTLTALPEDLKKDLFSHMPEPEVQAATLPLLLDASDPYGPFLHLGYILVAVFVLLAFWVLILSKRRTDMPERHPLCKRLLRYGPLQTVVPGIDADIASESSTFGDATFSRHWVLACWPTQAAVMRRDEIVWVYQKKTKHLRNGMSTGSTYALVLRDARGQLLELSSSEQDVKRYLARLAEETPWIIFGFDQKLDELYNKQLQSFVQAVSDRKANAPAAKP
jgi:hypothetical protein